MNWIARIFAYPALLDRLEDKDREIVRLREDIKELRDRLFIKHSLPVSGAEVKGVKAESVQGWTPKRARLKSFIDQQLPLVAPALSDEDLAQLREASQ